MIYIMGIIIFIIIIGIIVIVHEGGHLLVAKRNGVYCHEFSIGMGPKIKQFYKDKSGTVYNLRAIPLGGYVSIAGEDSGMEQDEKIPKDQRFDNKSKWIRFKILVAGATMNFILGILIYILIAFFTGVSVDDPHQIQVQSGSNLEKAGLESGDYVTAINGIQVNTYFDIINALNSGGKIAANKGVADETVYTLEYKEQEDGLYGEVKEANVQKDKTGVIGISDYVKTEKYHFFASVKYGFQTLYNVIIATFASLYLLVTGGASINEIAGPVGMATATTGIVTLGFLAISSWLAFLSLAVGVMNLLPIPALDGGRILFIVIELFRGKPLNAKIENFLNNLIFFGLLALMLYVTISDVVQIPDRVDIMNSTLSTDSDNSVENDSIENSDGT